MGAGPLRLTADAALSRELQALGLQLQSETIDAPDPGDPEVVRIAEADRRLAGRVRRAVGEGAFPLVLAGNCNSCLGTVAGLEPAAAPLGVVWFDAHADFDTPDRSLGFIDAMGLAILTGNGWRLLRDTIPGFAPIAERDVILIGVRDLEPHQRGPLEASAMRALPGSSFARAELIGALDDLRTRTARVYVHIDLDALDPSEGRANPFAAEGGLSLQGLEEAIELVSARFEVSAAALTSYDPGLDADGRMARAAVRVATTVARGARPEAAG
jgi:arginase